MSRTHRPVAITGALLAALGGGLLSTPAHASSPSVSVTCSSENVVVAKNASTEFSVECATSDNSPLDGFTLIAPPVKAASFSFDIKTGKGSYTPAAGFTGVDGFRFGATSGTAQSEPAKIVFDVANSATTCDAVEPVKTTHGRAVEIRITCTDADGDPIALQMGSNGAEHGLVTLSGTTATYTPNARFVGNDDFTVRGTDGSSVSKDVPVTVGVTNSRPVCVSRAASVKHSRPASIPVTCTDRDGDPLVLAVGAAAQQGRVTVVSNRVRYAPAARYVGDDTFTVTASDGVQSSAPARVNVAVTNAAPVCANLARISARAAVTFVIKCTDADGDATSIKVASAPRHGTVALVGNRVTYTPRLRYVGADSFRLRATDGIAFSASPSVPVQVLPARARAVRGVVSPRAVSVRVSCARNHRVCAGTADVDVRVGTSTINGFVRFSVRANRTATVTAQFTRAERRILARSKATSLPAVVVLDTRDSTGKRVRVVQRLTLPRSR